MSSRIFITAGLLGGLVALPSWAAGPNARGYDSPYDVSAYGAATLDERVAKLEKRLSSETIMEMSNRIEQLQGEVLKLHGNIEELTHKLDTLKKQQKDMYTDFDQRLQGGAGANAGATPSPEVSQQGDVPSESSNPPPISTPAPRVVATPTPMPVSASDGGRQTAYDKAFNLLREGKYPESAREFKRFLSAYPSGENVDTALYWMGEAYYVLRDFPASRDAFRKLVKDHPDSAKQADAMLKMAYIEYDTGQWVRARELLTDTSKRYPGSSAAKLAEKKLAKMKQEGH